MEVQLLSVRPNLWPPNTSTNVARNVASCIGILKHASLVQLNRARSPLLQISRRWLERQPFDNKGLPCYGMHMLTADLRKYHRLYYRKRRQAIFDYLGGKCVKCGATDNLHVDHIDPAKKSFHIGKRCSVNTIKEELDKCQLLCKDHHLEKTITEKPPFTHGTSYGWMKRKCKCAVCEAAKQAALTARREKRKIATTYSRGPYSKAVCGTDSMYTKGCRCDDCRQAHTVTARIKRAKAALSRNSPI